MSVALSRDIGAYLTARYGVKAEPVAAGAGDNTEVDSGYIDRQGYDSCKMIIGYSATLAEGKTLSIAANLQDATSSGGAGVADYGTAKANGVVATGGTGGSTETGVVELDFDLSGANQFIRGQMTPDLSATATDTADLMMIIILGGAVKGIVTAKAN
jgi:hypothetical protein